MTINAVRTRIRPTSDAIGWRDVTEERSAADKTATDEPFSADKAADRVEDADNKGAAGIP